MPNPKIYADFQNADGQGRVRLNCVGTLEDLAKSRVELRSGLPVTLYSDDADSNGSADELTVDGIVSFSDEEHCWVATIDWAALRHASDKPGSKPKRRRKEAPVKQRRPA